MSNPAIAALLPGAMRNPPHQEHGRVRHTTTAEGAAQSKRPRPAS
ncbi:hypothetical protein ART_1174 [Arthrobacter sp. PAMC 25486]|nr:hypothetical protein ART_1174 [Arthrobacter sp. PAMC 25486]